MVSSVNLAEVATILADHNLSETAIRSTLEELPVVVAPFDAELAFACAMLRPTTRHLGLSLGDRACLALAKRVGAPALTADRMWVGLDVGVEIRLIR